MKQFAVALLSAGLVVGSAGVARGEQAQPAQQAAPQETITISDPQELAAFKAIETAPTAAEKMTAAEAALSKYPTSAAKEVAEAQVFSAIAQDLRSAANDEASAALVKRFAATFPNSERTLDLERGLVSHHLAAKNYGEVYRIGEAWLQRNPNDPVMEFMLLQIGIEMLKANDPSKVANGNALEHGQRAIALMNANAKPAGMTDAQWQEWRAANEPLAHQLIGLASLQTGRIAAGKEHLEKAIALSPREPLNYFFLAAAKELEYDQIAQQYNALPEGNKTAAPGQKLKKDAEVIEDEIIDLLTKAVAFGSASPQYAPIVQQARPSLERHYKNRKGSLDGLEAAIQAASAP